MNRNMNRNMRRGGPGGGPYSPLATNHIRNLDEELESLQRRRELLQREQELLTVEDMYGRKRQYENNQPSRKFSTYDSLHQATQNFSHLYDNGPGPSFDRGGPQLNKKRHTISVWDNDRLNPNPNSINQRFGSYLGPKPQPMSPPKPLMSIVPKPSIGRRISGFPSKTARKDFTPNKVTKFNSHKALKPSPATSAPLKKALKSSTDGTKGSEILRADRVPSQQMTGRLELALGAILKEMKQDYCTNEESLMLFHSKHIQRSIKQSIRERLRTVMLNKVVGRYVDIVATYRETYPAKTDKEIVDTAILSTGSAEKHVRYNINRLLTKKLGEMFTKLQQLYEDKEEEVQKIIESSPIDMNAKQQEKTEASKKVEREFYSSLVESLLETKLPKLLPNYIDRIIKILEQDEEVRNVKQFKSKVQQRTKKPKEQSVTNEICDSETENDMIEVLDTDSKEASLKEETSEDKINEDIEVEKSEENHTTNVAETSAKTDIIEHTEVITNKETNVQESVETQKENPALILQYFVKVIGQPNLPNRNDAYKFLNQFNAVSIKKHKLVQNLLVVEFGNEKDFENAIAASGTVVGNSKLIIKANEKQQLNTTMPCPKDEGIGNNTEVSINILTSDIEHQISDLLSSIRQEEEGKSEKEIKTEDASNDITFENSQQSSVIDNKEIKKENMALDEDSKDNKMLEGTPQSDTLYSPTKAYDEDSQGLETIQKNAKIENEDAFAKSTSESSEVQGGESNQDVKSNNTKEIGKGTPMRTSSRLNNVTPSTIRTRRASRLTQNN